MPRPSRSTPVTTAPPQRPVVVPDATLLVRRATYGATPDLLAQVRSIGVEAWLRRQLAPSEIDDAACDAVLARLEGLDWDVPTAHAKLAHRDNTWFLMENVVRGAVVRAAWSNRQLEQVMVDVWSNHLNVTCPSDNATDNRQHYDAVIRRHAFGRYADLLKATIKHPSMIRYLNNESSSKTAPNENLGRELLELHTVGVEAGYTEADVRTSARILTGLSIDWPTGAMRYRPTWHWTGHVSVLGFSHPNADADGSAVLDAYLTHLARLPATARRIATKLAVRFVADDPSRALIDDLASVYLANDTAITPVLWRLFHSPEFASSAGRKLRRPYEDLIATLRALGLGPDAKGIDGIKALAWITGDLGDAPYGWPTPDGYHDVAVGWRSPAGTLNRWNTHMSLAANWWPKSLTRAPLLQLLGTPLPTTYGGLMDTLAARLLQQPLTSGQRQALCVFLRDQWNPTIGPSTPLPANAQALGWRLPYLVALVLDSPQFAVR
ncbi:MAG: DUF1800 domain-containing protein [Kineosporiaceae bacterium]